MDSPQYKEHDLAISGPSGPAFRDSPETIYGRPTILTASFHCSLHLISYSKGTTKSMQNLDMAAILAWAWHVTPVIAGGAAGYLFYRFVGCRSGVCPITRSPWLSTIYGALLGAMFMAG